MIVEGLGYATTELARSIDLASQGSIMPAISTIVPLIGSIKFIQRAAFRIIGE